MLVIDGARSHPLHEDGLPNYLAATLIDRDGTTHYALIRSDVIGDYSVQLDPTAAHAGHELPDEQLPLEIVLRLTISARKNRDERPEE